MKGKGLNCAAQSHRRARVHAAPRIDERTLAHENIRKQGKFPNAVENSLGEENARLALEANSFHLRRTSEPKAINQGLRRAS